MVLDLLEFSELVLPMDCTFKQDNPTDAYSTLSQWINSPSSFLIMLGYCVVYLFTYLVELVTASGTRERVVAQGGGLINFGQVVCDGSCTTC